MTDLAEIRWDAWHPSDLAAKLQNVERPWYVAGGWALDLWHGRQTRAHGDLEFCILRQDLSQFQTVLAEFPLYAAIKGGLYPVDDVDIDTVKQLWALDTRKGCWVFDMMIEPGTPDVWTYKRAPGFNTPRSKMVRYNGAGIPYLDPAAVLLFKAKHLRSKDQCDFDKACPKLTPAQRTWLRDALHRFHPEHAWLGVL